MTRQLPIVDMKGTPFYVDVLRDELLQQENPGNRIPFTAFEQEGDGYRILYDLETKNTPENWDGIMKESYQWVLLPALMELDAVGISMKYDIPLHILCPEMEDIEDEENYEDGEKFY